MLGCEQSDVLSFWDRAGLSVLCGSSAGILLLRMPTALPVAASGRVQLTCFSRGSFQQLGSAAWDQGS